MYSVFENELAHHGGLIPPSLIRKFLCRSIYKQENSSRLGAVGILQITPWNKYNFKTQLFEGAIMETQ